MFCPGSGTKQAQPRKSEAERWMLVSAVLSCSPVRSRAPCSECGCASSLPQHWLDAGSRDTVKVGVGLIATMTALVLALVTASAKNSFDAVDTTVKQTATQLLALDRVLARYGSETGEIRKSLQRDGWGSNRHGLGPGLIQPSQSGPDALGRSSRELSDSRTQSVV